MLWARSMAQSSNNPLLPLGLLYTEIFPATLPFHNSQATPQLTNHCVERLKPALDHKSCEQSSMQECACPCGPKIDLLSWSKQLQGGGCIPMPLQWDETYPSTGAGQYSKYLREQKFCFYSLFHPRAACGFLTAATWPQNLPMRNTAFHVLHSRQLLWGGCLV